MLLGAAQVSGAALVADMVGLSATVRGADLVVTGEGRLDFSSRRSKVISQVAEVAQQNARPCLAIVGDSQLGRRETAVMGLDEVISLTELVGAEAALQTPAESMREAASMAASSWTRVKTGLDPR
jgi:glycerate kinase